MSYSQSYKVFLTLCYVQNNRMLEIIKQEKKIPKIWYMFTIYWVKKQFKLALINGMLGK